jgi:adenylate cyclase
MERRLVAILAADVVGYSRLMEQDEAGTIAALKERRHGILNPLVARHRGRVVRVVGDGVLVEFASAVEGVLCAAELQQQMAAANAGLANDRAIVLRIGVNLGDLAFEGSELYGDGINVAARLEALAEPGTIYVSGKVRDEVCGKLDLALEDLGERRLKNISAPIRVYRVADASTNAVPAANGLPLPDKPSIAVLPFQNLSGDPGQEYLADGLTEDITTGLSRVRALFVIARTSANVYKGHPVAVAQVARDLGVRYVMEGSVRRSDRRVRITAQLVEATTGRQVWAERFDREFVEIFDLQDEITRNVVASTQTQIILAEGSALSRRDRPDVGVWSLVSRAMMRGHELTREGLADAKRLAEQALKLDPNCGPAWRCLSAALHLEAHMLMAEDYDATMARALETAERSVHLDGNDEYAHWNLGNVLMALGRHDRAIAELERALEINPNCSMAIGSLGTGLCYVGRPAEGIVKNEIAMRSDPLNPGIFFRYSGLALGHFLAGDYERAAEWARKSIQRNRHWYLGHVYLMAALARSGRIAEAQDARREYLQLFPRASFLEVRRLPLRNSADFERLCAGLRKAGLPE